MNKYAFRLPSVQGNLIATYENECSLSIEWNEDNT